jgi:hypothetical protein
MQPSTLQTIKKQLKLVKSTGTKYIILNSTNAFIIACILAMTLHEFGHFFASLLVKAKGVSIHHNYVNNIDEGLSPGQLIFIRAAGPIVSLLIGLVFHFICYKDKARGISFLLKLYFSSFGYIGFFGYLLVAPFFTSGDTGYVFKVLGFPIGLTIGISIAGALILFFIMKSLMQYFVELGSREIIENNETRKKFISSLILIPVFIGIIITTLLNLPTINVISLIAPMCSPFTFLWTYSFALKKRYLTNNYNSQFYNLNKPHIWLYLFFALTIIANRLLVYGIYVN